MFKRAAVFLYGVLCYVAFFGTFLYAIGFIGNMFLAHTMDSAVRAPFWQALLIDVALLGVFAVQHSVMARPAFKRFITRFIPEPAERSTYVLLSSLALILLFAYWQPIGGTIWNVTDPSVRNWINVVYGFGLALVLVTTFLINHFDLFGLRQVSLYLMNEPYTHLEFRTPLFYKFVRHPLYIGWMTAFWATPTMTGAHLLFAVMTTVYMLMAIRWEEKDLLDIHGEHYERYRQEVPKLVPSLAPYRPAEEKTGRRLGTVA